ncbi:MAG TPA: hypothetical protein DHW73_11205, partial [Pseudomonas sp.]|nr:hypothetical protein [Pseudomonas sp.]
QAASRKLQAVRGVAGVGVWLGRLKAEGLRLEGVERRRWLDVMQAGKSVLTPLVVAGENFGFQPKAFSLKPGFACSLPLLLSQA